MHNHSLYKKGVSLVTVLIFMMVATIAATATYKWLSSVGFTSADRMALAEAKESSHAGIDAVRSWMTYHANDVGAIIRQYYDGGKKPVALTNLVHGVASSKQQFSVWLTGVDASRDAYKFTIVSTGTSRTDAKYSETSVLNVRGLYKVKEPVKITHKTLDYGYSYFGGSTKGASGVKNTSMLVNGNWKGNPPFVDEDFVVTGYADLSGNGLSLGKHTCIGGYFNAENNGVNGENLYVHGEARKFKATLSGNSYFDGDVTIENTGGITATGDVTINGRYYTGQSVNNTINGNFCMGSSGVLAFGKNAGEFKALKNVKLMRRSDAVEFSEGYNKDKTILGGMGNKVYLKEGKLCSESTSSVCTGLPPWQKSKFLRYRKGSGTATLIGTSGSVVNSSETSMACDESIKTYCLGENALGAKKTGRGCDHSDFKIDDVLTTAYDNFKNKTGTSCGNIVPEQGKSYSMATLNNCYSGASSTQLYNGFLVVKLNQTSSTTILSNPDGTLDGNFIFYADDLISGEMKMPPMTQRSNAFVYLEKGANRVNAKSAAGSRNYFFYSKGNISVLQNDGSDRKWSGSFYMTAENCAKIEDINTADMYLEYNAKLVQTLLDSAVICNISEEGSCGTSQASSEGEGVNTSGEDNVEGYDVHYVATAPQLSVTLESQRRNREVLYDNLKPSEYTTVKPSIVVMPRIVYLDDKAEGKLQDYFTVVNLNGARETFDASKTSCTPALNPTGVLRTGDEKLNADVYKCEYTATNVAYGKNRFWVVVDGDVAGVSRVYFTKMNQRVFAGGIAPVNVDIHADTIQTAPVTVTIRVSRVFDGWTVTKSDIVSLVGSQDADGSQLYSVTLNPGESPTLFSVKTDDDAEKNMVSFTIESLSANARVGNPSTSTVQMTGEGFINRKDITESFCNSEGHKTIDGVDCMDIAQREDCAENLTSQTSGEWITAECPDRYMVEANNKWQCSFAGTSQIKLVAATLSPLCDLFIHDSSLQNLTEGKEYNLFASYKAKAFDFTTVLKNASHAKVNAYVTKDVVKLQDFDKSSVTPIVCKDSCTFKVSAGYHVILEPVENGDDFNRWHIGGKDTANVLLNVLVSSDTVAYAYFNDSDDHCFYSDFENTEIWCKQNISDCIDKCNGIKQGGSCTTKSGGSYSNSAWIVTRTNDGGNYSSPKKDAQNFLWYSNGKQNNSGNSSIAYMLSRAEAGSHGKLTARFKTCAKQNGQKNLNSGFILRSTSNSDQYAIVNILGVSYGAYYQMVARVCEGDGSGIKNSNSGDCHEVTFPGLTVPAYEFPTTIFNTDIDLRSDKANITLSYKQNGSWRQSKASLDISVSAATNPSDHFVGASLADDCFKLGNISWESYDFGDYVCTDIPQLSCSFAANYMGGVLPLNESVTPWVGTSKWFNDPNDAFKLRSGCSISYHYNGCDLRDGYSAGTCTQWLDGSMHCSGCSHMSDEGPYYVSGLSAETMRGEDYAFTFAGAHGVAKEYLYNGSTIDGAVRDASVVVDCGDDGLYEKTCGRFMVGKLTQCAQSVGFRVSECDGGSECVVTVVGGSANLRASSLVGEITGLPNDDGSGNRPVVTMVLKDIGGHSSQQIQINGNGHFSNDVNFYSDMQDFNPEQVASIELSSNYGFTLSKLQSDCPNSIGVYNCDAVFDGNSIEITSNIVNAQGATCKIEGIGSDINLSERDCPANGAFTIPAVKLQEAINASSESGRDYTFKITMTSKENKNLEETCVTPPMTVNSSGLRCELGSGIDKLKPGQSIPMFYYAASGCPSTGCEMTLSLNNGNRVQKTYKNGGELDHWNAEGTLKVGTYIYKVEFAGAMCYKEFEVTAEGSDKPIDNCSIDEATKTFTADLNMPTKTALTLVATDLNGNTMSSPLNSQSNGNKYSHKLPELTKPGDYLFVLKTGKGKEEASCSVPYTVEDTEMDDIGCYIEGGRFKTKAKNTTQYDKDVALNCGPIGETWGNTVSSGQWEVNHVVDLDANLELVGDDCKEYHLYYAGNMLCAYPRPEKAPEEGDLSGKCSIYDEQDNVVHGNVKQGHFILRVTDIKNVPNGAKLDINGQAAVVSGNSASLDIWSGNGNGTIGYIVKYNNKTICTIDLKVKNK